MSALVFPGGSGEAALLRIIEERDELLLSKPIVDELLGVLARKFSRDAEELARAPSFSPILQPPCGPAAGCGWCRTTPTIASANVPSPGARI
ncbi:MAG: hypothetical protein ACREKH_19450 [Candidatus Rokuibacteriota bacterium]